MFVLIPWDDAYPWISKAAGGMLLGLGSLQLIFYFFVKKVRVGGVGGGEQGAWGRWRRRARALLAHTHAFPSPPHRPPPPHSFQAQTEGYDVKPSIGSSKTSSEGSFGGQPETPTRQQLLVAQTPQPPTVFNPVHMASYPAGGSQPPFAADATEQGRQGFAPVSADGAPVTNPFGR